MKLVILESPFAQFIDDNGTLHTVDSNIEYARACVRDSLSRAEAPIASHLLYTQQGILDDDVPEERSWGIDAGLAWKKVAEESVVYIDRGLTRGMMFGIKAAENAGLKVTYRTINA